MKELNNNGYGYIGFVLLKVPCTSVKGRVHVFKFYDKDRHVYWAVKDLKFDNFKHNIAAAFKRISVKRFAHQSELFTARAVYNHICNLGYVPDEFSHMIEVNNLWFGSDNRNEPYDNTRIYTVSDENNQ